MRRRVAIGWLLVLTCAVVAQERKAASVAGQFRISGVVVNDTNNQPLAATHVTITAAQGGAAQTTMTGAGGGFAFDHVPAGKYMLSAERRGFASQQYQQHEGRFSTAIVAGPNLDTGNIVFRALPDASFSGTITDDQGEAVRGARVMLIHERMAEGILRKVIAGNAMTNDQGHYHFAHVKPGAYYLAVSARPWYAEGSPRRMGFGGGGVSVAGGGGFGGTIGSGGTSNPALDVAYPLTFYPDVTDSAAARPITLRAGDRAAADFTLRAVQAVHVRINVSGASEDRDEPRGFSARLAHTVFDGLEIPMPATMGRDRGRMVMMDVPPGRYLLRFNEGRSRPQDGEEVEDGSQQGRVREVELLSDTELDASEMPAAAAVSGSVKAADGRALPKAPEVLLRSRSMRRAFVARSSQDGKFTFPRGVPAGSYEISMDGGEDTFIQRVSATGAKVMGRTVEISSGAVQLSVVASSGMARVEGVAQRDGKPQAGVMILLVPNDPENHLPLFRRDQSDSDGSFTLTDVLPGRYTLLALEKGWELSWSEAEALKPFLAGGEALVVQRKGNYNVHVKVQ